MRNLALIAAVLLCVLSGCGNDRESNAQLLRNQQRKKDAAAQTTLKTSEQRLALAEDLLVQGNVELAEATARKLLISEPANPRVIVLAAGCQATRGNLVDAAEMLDTITSDDSEVVIAALSQAADWLIDADRLDLAHLKLEQLLRTEGETNRVRHQLARVLNNQGRRIEAKTHLHQLARSGDATEMELYSMNSFADPFIDSTLPPPDREGDLTMTMLAKAKQFWVEGKLSESYRLTALLAEKFPQSHQVAAFRGRIYADLLDDEALIAWAKELPANVEREPEYWRAIATWLQRHGHHDQAIRCFAEAIAIDETDRFAYLGIAQSLTARGESESARTATERYDLLDESARIAATIGKAPGSVDQLERLAEILDRLNRPWEAIGWREVSARTHGITPKEREALRQRRQELTNDTEPNGNDPLKSIGVDLSHWPLPTDNLINIESDSNSDSIAEDAGEQKPIRLSNVAPRVGLDFKYVNGDQPGDNKVFLHQLTGGGIGAIDYDLDGWPDLYMTQAGGDAFDPVGSQPNQLFKNRAGRTFENATDWAGVGDLGYGQGVAVADVNQDGFADLVIANLGPNLLYINNGDGTFNKRSLQPAVTTEDHGADGDWTTSIAVGDLSGDHLPEIVEVNYVDDPSALTTPCVDNEGLCNPSRFHPATDRILWAADDGTFVEQPSLMKGIPSHGFSAVIANFDKQGGNDLFIANDADRNHYWRTNHDPVSGSLSMVECGQAYGCAMGLGSARHGCMGIAAGDFDRNGWLDLHVTNFWNQPADLYLQLSDGLFVNGTVPYGLFQQSRTTVGWGTQAVDLDRNGWLDLAVLNGHVTRQGGGIPFRMRPQLFRGQAKRFLPASPDTGGESYWTTAAHGRTMAVLDWNRDGRPDLVTGHLNDQGALLENQTETAGWIQLELVGTESERDAIGAEVICHLGELRLTNWVIGGDGFLCSNEAIVDFGIGNRGAIDRIEIRWPSGMTQTFDSPQPNRRYLAIEGGDELFLR